MIGCAFFSRYLKLFVVQVLFKEVNDDQKNEHLKK